MPVTPTYPGVYIEEIPSGVHPITGVATSITAFVGYAERGPVNEPTTIQSFAEFVRVFGGLWSESTMTHAVQQFFLNGGSEALIVRVAHLSGGGTLAVTGALDVGAPNTLHLEAKSPGEWSKNLLVRIDDNPTDPTVFTLSVKDLATGQVEVLRNLKPVASLGPVVEAQSRLVNVVSPFPAALPTAKSPLTPGEDPFDPNQPSRYDAFSGGTVGVDGDQTEDDLFPASQDTGMYALARADLFNLLCIPPLSPASDTSATDRILSSANKSNAAEFCFDHRAFFLVDPDPDWKTPADVTTGGDPLDNYVTNPISADFRRNCGLYMPYVRLADPLAGALDDFPPCGVVAGVMARTDAERGVWKAPAGVEAGLNGVQELTAKLTDGENGTLNPLGVNCLRTFPVYGNVVWGARTLVGADVEASEWKYVPVRRFALFLEESLYRGTKWVVFEPNDEPLWAQIRLNVGSFMHDLFRKGAFKGATPRDAYLVKCDGETTTQTDINNGVVNIVVGFAPLKPAEFVIIQIQQLAGQIET